MEAVGRCVAVTLVASTHVGRGPWLRCPRRRRWPGGSSARAATNGTGGRGYAGRPPGFLSLTWHFGMPAGCHLSLVAGLGIRLDVLGRARLETRRPVRRARRTRGQRARGGDRSRRGAWRGRRAALRTMTSRGPSGSLRCRSRSARPDNTGSTGVAAAPTMGHEASYTAASRRHASA